MGALAIGISTEPCTVPLDLAVEESSRPLWMSVGPQARATAPAKPWIGTAPIAKLQGAGDRAWKSVSEQDARWE